ncbi:MAG TPA: hypothetical protein VKS25_15550 [Solirubrobacteraceae bacterium]|nr:hypothetical protein [Solirubrobacteraceae bacterium]
MSATLRVIRRHPLMELRRGPFEIELDGNSAGSINKIDETVEIPLEPGQHTLRIHTGRYSSPERSFTSADGELVSFRTRGPLIWPVYVTSLVAPNVGISLKRE